MDEMGAEEDTGGADVDVAGPAIATTISATLQKMSSWEQTVLAAQQLGVRRRKLMNRLICVPSR